MAQSGMTEVEWVEFVTNNYEPGVKVDGESMYICKTCAALIRLSYFCATDTLQRHVTWHKELRSYMCQLFTVSSAG